MTGADRLGSPVERHPATISDKPQTAIAKTVAVVDMAPKADRKDDADAAPGRGSTRTPVSPYVA